MPAQGVPRRGRSHPGDGLFGVGGDLGDLFRADHRFGGGHDGVAVGVAGVAQLQPGILGFPDLGGRRAGGSVGQDDLLDGFHHRLRGDRLGFGDVVGVALTADLQVEIVAVAAAGHSGVELVSGQGGVTEQLGGVGGQPLHGGQRVGVAQAYFSFFQIPGG